MSIFRFGQHQGTLSSSNKLLTRTAPKRFVVALSIVMASASLALVGPNHPASADPPPNVAAMLAQLGIDPHDCVAVVPVSKAELLAALPDLANDPEIAAADWVAPDCIGGRPSPQSPVTPDSGDSTASVVTRTFDNWSGFISFKYNNQVWNTVQGDWTVPTLYDALPPNMQSQIDRSAAWVGIGNGDSKSKMLAQAGTEQTDNFNQCTSAGCGQSKQYSVWWEFYPKNSQQFLGAPTVSPGDHVHVVVEHSGSGEAYIIINNVSTNKMTSFYKTWDSTYTLDTSQVEWIFERPSAGGYNWPLPPQTDVKFTQAQGITPSQVVNVGVTDRAKVTMVASCTSSTAIATPSTIGSDNKSFSVSWVGWGVKSPNPC